MDIIISQMPYFGWSVADINALPPEFGVEFFIEFGNDFYWHHSIDEIMDGRTGRISFHGPFTQMNLADKRCDFSQVKETYRIAFEYCVHYNAAHCVCHPHSVIPDYPGYTPHDGQQLALERVRELNEISKRHGVEMLVENMPYRQLVFGQDDFLKIFGGAPELNFLIDTGHAILNGWNLSTVQRTLGSRIHAYHIHDNLGDFDAHLRIKDGPSDWEAFFLDYQRYTPGARLVLEYSSWNPENILENVAYIKAMKAFR